MLIAHNVNLLVDLASEVCQLVWDYVIEKAVLHFEQKIAMLNFLKKSI